MKKLGFLALAAMVMMGVAFASCDSRKSVSLKTEIDSVSYIIGASYGRGLSEELKKIPGVPGNVAALISGFLNGANGDSIHLGMDMATAQNYINTYFQGLQAKEMEVKAAEAEVVKAEGAKFLAENAKQSGVITTESGLQYKVITEGKGRRPKLGEEIKVHYHGTLLDGSVFDSSVNRGEPAVFELGKVIEGWNEGLQLMPVGSKYTLWVPSSMAYDPYGPGPNNPYYGKLLKFEVELLEIVKK
jgi:FKBP-type peptidyl-prolyl cis-trans isomerase FkpA/FKBP-type peptidyl-prolyl cis-trans isomerase FklB